MTTRTGPFSDGSSSAEDANVDRSTSARAPHQHCVARCAPHALTAIIADVERRARERGVPHRELRQRAERRLLRRRLRTRRQHKHGQPRIAPFHVRNRKWGPHTGARRRRRRNRGGGRVRGANNWRHRRGTLLSATTTRLRRRRVIAAHNPCSNTTQVHMSRDGSRQKRKRSRARAPTNIKA